MSNFTTKPQVPENETVIKRGETSQTRAYKGSAAGAPIEIYDDINDAPAATNLPDGTPALERSGATNVVLYIAQGGTYKATA